MAAVENPPEQRVVLERISWETYQRLLGERGAGGPRFAYDDGTLEIMTTGFSHETLKRSIDLFVEIVAAEMKIRVEGGGSTTFKREDLAKGFEPDACFYIQHFEQVRGKEQIDLTIDPPPDLVIEIDLTNSSLNKFQIFSAIGVPEVWRYSGSALTIWKLAKKRYVAQSESSVLPGITGEAILKFVRSRQTLDPHIWIRSVRDWVRSL